MRSPKHRLLLLIATLPVITLFATLLYMVGSVQLEGNPEPSFWRALEFVSETLTTTGYGYEARWDHPIMALFVISLQWTGVFLVFLVFPIFLIPFLEQRFQTRLPTEVDLEDHLVVYGWGPAVSSLVERTRHEEIPTVVVEEDEPTARRLLERGFTVVSSRLDDGALEGARLLQARALIANASDEINAAVILAARQEGFAGDILALVEEPLHRRPLRLAGATAVFTPRHVLGAALAARASARISPRVAGVQQVGRLQVHQVRVDPGSTLADRTVEEAAIGARTSAVVIGQWRGGRLEAPVTADTRILPGAILVVVGTDDSVERLSELCVGAVPLARRGPFLVAGRGEVGRKVVQLLDDADEEVVVVDRQPKEGVDVVGDVLNPKILESLGLDDHQAVILALDTDSAALFATVIVKEIAPQVPVIARVNRAENVDRLHQAGADFALSISQVSGQILSHRLLGEEAVALDPQLKVVKVPDPGPLVGRHPAELAIRERTGCSVVAVDRDGEVITEMGPEFRFEERDTVYVSGSTEATRRFMDEVVGEG